MKTSGRNGIVYDAKTVCRVLALTCECSAPTPQPIDGEIVIYWGGWRSAELMKTIEPHDPREMARLIEFEEPPSGWYRLMMPVPNSGEEKWDRVGRSPLSTVHPGWSFLPALLGLTALVVHLDRAQGDLLEGNTCRCGEEVGHHAHHATIHVFHGIVQIGAIDDWHYINCLRLGASKHIV